MSKILVTGAGGFIGSHLTELLVERGYDVKVFLRYNSKNNWGWLENSHIKNEIDYSFGDIRDFDSVYSSLKDVDTVFHLAALIGIPYSYVSPKAYIDTNVMGTYNVLQSARELGLNNIIITSTSETYGTAQYVPINENHPIVGQSPYSASKIASDQLAISYYRSFKLPIKIVRPFNTYGPRQSLRAVIPTILAQLLDGFNKIKVGSLNPTRDFTYVSDTCKGFLEIWKSEKLYGEVTNIGSNKEISISNLILKIAEYLNMNISIDFDEGRIRPKDSEVERLICDNIKIKNNTSWEPEINLRAGIQSTFEWLTENKNLLKTKIYNI